MRDVSGGLMEALFESARLGNTITLDPSAARDIHNALAAREARDKRIRDEALREAGVTVDELAQAIRTVDGNHDLGAGELAERILSALQGETPKRLARFTNAADAAFAEALVNAYRSGDLVSTETALAMVAEEREACTEIAEQAYTWTDHTCDVAEAIRARPEGVQDRCSGPLEDCKRPAHIRRSETRTLDAENAALREGK